MVGIGVFARNFITGVDARNFDRRRMCQLRPVAHGRLAPAPVALTLLASLITASGALADEAYATTLHADKGSRHLPSPTDPEVLLGDRLFFETRFAQYYFANAVGVNDPPIEGDPTVDTVERQGKSSLEGPFRNRSISCRHCHLGNDFERQDPLAQRTYCDFAARSRIPRRNDGLTHTTRNSSMLVDLGTLVDRPRVLHFDGEFSSMEDLIFETLVGRNMGWQFAERNKAIAHIARVIREDRGGHPRHFLGADGTPIPYSIALLATDRSLPAARVIPSEYRLDVQRASDAEIVVAVSRLIHVYLNSIRFGVEGTARETISPYDLFLHRNHLPQTPVSGESMLSYARRLRKAVDQRSEFTWVNPATDGRFVFHDQPYQFGELELNGMKIFLRESNARDRRLSVGNCVQCHTPPLFTDYRLHNTGVSQAEYDKVFGGGAFARLDIPTLSERNNNPKEFLPASPQNPDSLNRWRSVPTPNRPGFADLGAWNIVANSDFPKPQFALSKLLCGSERLRCSDTHLLARSVAAFKTPSIRDLGHSAPYFHSGAAEDIDSVLRLYVESSNLKRRGKLVNGASELRLMHISNKDVGALRAFLQSLNEDYH